MARPRVRRAYTLPPERIQELDRDLEILAAGGKVLYAVDPYEIIDFCFPVDPNDSDTLDFSSVADRQIAGHDLFYRDVGPRPLLIPLYESELARHLSFVKHSASSAYQDTEILSAFLKDVQLSHYKGVTRQQKLETLESEFNVLLAAFLGIYSIGVARLHEVMGRVQTIHNTPDLLKYATINGVTELVADIERRLLSGYEFSRLSPVSHDRLRHSIANDARAIGWLLAVNTALEQDYIAGKRADRLLVLYLSSAPRTERIFRGPSVLNALPTIAGTSYPIWRHTDQLLAQIIAKGASTGPDFSSEDIKHRREGLKVLKTISSQYRNQAQVHRGTQECNACILDGGVVDDCRFLEFCRSVRGFETTLLSRQSAISNLKLVQTIQRYGEIRDRLKSRTRYQEYLSVFDELVNDRELQDVALQRMRTLEFIILVQAEFSGRVAAQVSKSQRAPLKEGRDVITSKDIYLPSYPNLRSDCYRRVAAEIVECYMAPPEQVTVQATLFERACVSFLQLESEASTASAEHELVRCLLYLAFSEPQGDQDAYEHARRCLQRYHGPDRLEFYYVLIWVTRRLRKYVEGYKFATQAIQLSPADPRLYHGRGLLIYAFYADIEYRSMFFYGGAAALEDIDRAIKLYYEQDRERYRRLLAAAHTNLAYLRCIDDPLHWRDLYSPERARQDLNFAKRYVPTTEWYPDYPEYFHAEATVLFHEYLKGKTGSMPRDALLDKLRHAREMNLTAGRLFPKASFAALTERIDAEIGC